MRRASRVDNNQSAIVGALRAHGYSVTILSGVGDGCPDIVVGAYGSNYLFEIKDSQKPPSARKLTPAEKIWHATWTGQAAIITTAEQAVHEIERNQP